jgi:tripartite-type tricarboxylate transporter receptor subunit TctC
MNSRRGVEWLVLALFMSAASALAQTQSTGSGQVYPTKPVRLLVPAPPGGGTDILARVVAPKLSEGLGQSVIIENRGGAGGNIAAELVAKSPPDGYTLIIVNTAFSVVPSLYRNLPFDPARDFAPITHLMISPLLLVAHPSVPVTSVRGLINLAKARPGELNFASSGSGQSNHLAAELFKSMAKVDMVHVPYKGGGPVLTDLLGGHITLFFGSIISTLPHAKSGRLRPLGVTSLKRAHAAPDVPTIAEAALPGFEAVGWYGILAPAGTSKEILSRLSRDVVRGLQAPEVQDRIIKDGGEPVGGTPEQFSAFIRAEIAKWAEVVRVSGARAD